jgi:hypothetical protein
VHILQLIHMVTPKHTYYSYIHMVFIGKELIFWSFEDGQGHNRRGGLGNNKRIAC